MLSVLDSNAWKILPCGEAQRRFARRIFFGNAMRSHIEMQTQENIDAGMNPEEARYAAFRQFEWVESIK